LKKSVPPTKDRCRKVCKGEKRNARMQDLKGCNIRALVDNDVVPVVKEEGSSSGKSTIEAVRWWIVEKLLRVRRTREGGDLENRWHHREGISLIKLTPHHAREKRRLHHWNQRSRQSARCKMKGKVGDKRQDNGTDDVRDGRINVNCNRCKEPEAKTTTPTMMVACVMGAVVILKTNFNSRGRAAWRKNAKRAQVEVLIKCLCERKEPRDNVDGGRLWRQHLHGSWWGQKT
jgi:hypothetical protein